MRRKSVFLVLLLCSLSAGCERLTGEREVPLDPATLRSILLSQVHIETSSPRLRAGVAREEITPPVGTPLAGYARRRGKPSTGIHDPLYVRVLVLEDGTDRLILASSDLVAVHEDLYRAVLDKLHKRLGIQRQELFLFATHTHSGTGALGKRFLERLIGGRYRKEIFDRTVHRIVKAVDAAVRDTAPARFGVGRADLGSVIENRMIEGGALDSEMQVLRIDREARPLAFLVAMAAHPTVLNANNFLFSADYPGYLQRHLESRYPESVCLFANGAAGDLRLSAFTEHEGFARAQAAGEYLGARALKIARPPRMRGRGELVMLGTNFWLPPVRIRRGALRLPSFIGNRLIPREVGVNVARLNNIVFISIPGEMTADIGMEIKEAARREGFEPFLIGYANGYIGYIIPEKYYGSDTYEAGVTFFGPRLDRYFVNYSLAQIRFQKEHAHA